VSEQSPVLFPVAVFGEVMPIELVIIVVALPLMVIWLWRQAPRLYDDHLKMKQHRPIMFKLIGYNERYYGVDHHEAIVVHLKAVRRRRIAVGKMFVDEKETQRIVAVETETKPAAPLVEVREQPAFAMEILDVFDRLRELGVILSGARCDALSNECVNALNQALLFLSEAEVQACYSLLRSR
jgi:hypothetical protein